MVSETLEFYAKGLRAMGALSLARTAQRIQSVGHYWNYQATPSPKNVVIIGGSYAGTRLAQRLTETLPTGYRAVLIERNSHFNHFFVFPRFSILPGKEDQAFIPYDGLARGAPNGIFEHIRDSATEITPTQVRLASGDTVDYEYLALTTGSWQPAPSKYDVREQSDGCAAFQTTQRHVQEAQSIAVIGGGPVGVQMATDIKSFYPRKDVTLIHSRDQLLSSFGPRLQQTVMQAVKKLKVHVCLGERPQMALTSLVGPGTLTFKNGTQRSYDLVLQCTGQRPNSGLLAQLAPAAIDPQSRQILVHPTLQINDGTGKYPNIFSFGDVAKTGGPRFARAARAQAEIATSNILAMIHGHALKEYHPAMYEGAIKLTLGKSDFVFCGREADGREIMKHGKSHNDYMEIAQAWHDLGARLDFPEMPGGMKFGKAQNT